MTDNLLLANQRRLVVSGERLRSDGRAVTDAIEVVAGLVDPLVLDLTGVQVLPQEIAVSVIGARRGAERAGHQVGTHTIEEDQTVRLLDADARRVAPLPHLGRK